MANISVAPDAPKYLDAKTKKKWQDAWLKAVDQAKRDYPDNESGQRTVATKDANKLLSVPAPESADEIDALETHQVIKRERRNIDGVEHAVCVTADGRKYQHPVVVKAKKADPAK
jgi:hypothetical protein